MPLFRCGGSVKKLINKRITSNGTYDPKAEGVDGYEEVVVNEPLGTLNITADGVYNASSYGYKGFTSVTISAD